MLRGFCFQRDDRAFPLNEEVDLSALPKGTYVVKDGKRTYKIMKR